MAAVVRRSFLNMEVVGPCDEFERHRASKASAAIVRSCNTGDLQRISRVPIPYVAKTNTQWPSFGMPPYLIIT